MKSLISLVALICLVSTVCSFDFLSKNCCDPHDDLHLGWICDDGKRAPTIGCCGNGPCNVFCCNCDGGCRTGNRKPQTFLGVWGHGISSNLGMTGNSAPATVEQMGKAVLEDVASEIKEGLKEIITAKKEEDQSGIEYIPWKKNMH